MSNKQDAPLDSYEHHTLYSKIEIAGPEDTPYHGGSFKIDINIPER
jgi:ubiquitin-protein ligase